MDQKLFYTAFAEGPARTSFTYGLITTPVRNLAGVLRQSGYTLRNGYNPIAFSKALDEGAFPDWEYWGNPPDSTKNFSWAKTCEIPTLEHRAIAGRLFGDNGNYAACLVGRVLGKDFIYDRDFDTDNFIRQIVSGQKPDILHSGFSKFLIYSGCTEKHMGWNMVSLANLIGIPTYDLDSEQGKRTLKQDVFPLLKPPVK